MSDWSATRESRTWFNCFNNGLVGKEEGSVKRCVLTKFRLVTRLKIVHLLLSKEFCTTFCFSYTYLRSVNLVPVTVRRCVRHLWPIQSYCQVKEGQNLTIFCIFVILFAMGDFFGNLINFWVEIKKSLLLICNILSSQLKSYADSSSYLPLHIW